MVGSGPRARQPHAPGDADAPSRAPQLSLKARALRYLATREHSRLELARKLARYTEDPEEVERVLDELSARGWLSAQRFAESVVHRRSAAFGQARIRMELQQHGVDREVAAPVLAALQGTEHQRAHEVWQRRFGVAPRDLKERARQQRFLLSRGFSGDIVRQVLRQAGAGLDAAEDGAQDGDGGHAGDGVPACTDSQDSVEGWDGSR